MYVVQFKGALHCGEAQRFMRRAAGRTRILTIRYLLVGFLCFCWLKHEEGEEEPTTVQKHSREGYNLAALLFFFLFLDNLLRRVGGQGWKGFWPCSGRFEVVVLFGMLSLVACVLVADCQRPQSRARLKPETMRVTFEEFSPPHDFFDYRADRTVNS
jgi:hypothetical protein